MLEERGLGGDIIHDLPYIYQNVYRLNSQTISNGKGTYIRLHMKYTVIHYTYIFIYISELISEQAVKPAAQMEKNEICLHFIRRKCKFQGWCPFHRSYLC